MFFAMQPEDSVIEISISSYDKGKRLEITELEYFPPSKHAKPLIIMTLGEKK